MKDLTIDHDILIATADIITAYTKRQKEVVQKYLSNFTSLVPNWSDDETFAPLITEINTLRKAVIDKMEIIEATYPSYFRNKAETISSRPVFNSKSSASGTSNHYSGRTSAMTMPSIMSNSPINSKTLNDEMCRFDGVVVQGGYVRTSSNGRRIADLDQVGTFLSPANGKQIYCKTIAWRSSNSVQEANSQNICGADFYYADGSYCGSYIGKNWQDIYDNNLSDTKVFRK